MQGIPWYDHGMKLGISLPDELVDFADHEADRTGTTRSGFLARLLREEQVRRGVAAYIDRHGWDVAEDEEGWRTYQVERLKADYGSDDW